MTLEINDKSYNYVLELIAQKTKLNEEYDVLNQKISAPPFDVEYFEDLTKEQLNELNAIFDEMKKLSGRMDTINMQIAMCVESNLNSYKK